MTELTKLEQLEKAVQDAALSGTSDAYAASDTTAEYARHATYNAWSKAKLELSNYLKEQENVLSN